MPDQQRLLELALKGLEAERERINDDIAEIHRQLRGRTPRAANGRSTFSLGLPRTRRPMSAAARRRISEGMKRRYAQMGTSTSGPSQAASRKAGGLTAAGRKKLSDMMRARWAAKRKVARKK